MFVLEPFPPCSYSPSLDQIEAQLVGAVVAAVDGVNALPGLKVTGILRLLACLPSFLVVMQGCSPGL